MTLFAIFSIGTVLVLQYSYLSLYYSYWYQVCPVLADLYFYSYETYINTGASQKTKRNYIDDAFSLRNSNHLLIELEIKLDTAYTASRTASYIDLHIKIDSAGRRLRTKRDNKRGNFNRKSNDLQLVFQNSTCKRWMEYQDNYISVSNRI